MKIRCIFEKVSDRLFAVVFDHDAGNNLFLPYVDQGEDLSLHGLDEIERNFTLWADASWLRNFFMHYRADLMTRDAGMSVKQAVNYTVCEARDLYDVLVSLGGGTSERTLIQLFKPLDNREDENRRYMLQMMKAKRPRSWLRLYALRYGDAFIITGGAIKLTDKMNRPHLQHELYKLRAVQRFLGDEEEEDKAFVYLDI